MADLNLGINVIGKDQASAVLKAVQSAADALKGRLVDTGLASATALNQLQASIQHTAQQAVSASDGVHQLAQSQQAVQSAASQASQGMRQAGDGAKTLDTAAREAAKGLNEAGGAAKKSGGDAEQAKGSWLDLGNVLGSVAGGVGKLALAGGAGALAGLVGIGAAGVAAWGDYDAALDTVMQKTGMTGAALDDIGNRVRNLSTGTAGVGTDMAHIGEVMADLAVRTGTTGDTLEGLTAQLLHLQQVQGEGAVSAANFGRLLGDWGVPAEQGAAKMDQLFTASQKFGVTTDSLAAKLVQFGSPLRQMGFDLNTSIAMFGQFEQQGVNTELVLGSLRIAAGKFADAGVPLKAGLQSAITSIRDMEDSSAALATAMDIFGARAGPDMAAAIREGKFSLDDAVASIQNYQGSIQGAAEGAMDFPDQWAMGMNQIKAALVPVGQAVMDLGSAAMPVLQVGFSMASGAITSFASGISTLASTVGPAVSAIGGFFADSSMEAETLETTLSGIVGSGAANALTDLAVAAYDFSMALQSAASGGDWTGSLVSGITNVARAFGMPEDAAAQFSLTLGTVLGSLASAAQGAGSAVGSLLAAGFQTAGQIASTVLAGLPALLQAVSGPISTIAGLVGSVLSSAFQSAGQIIQAVFGVLPGLVQVGMSVLTALAGTVSSIVAGAFQILAPIAQSVFAGIATVVQMAMPAVLNLAQAVGSLLSTAFNVLRDIALAVFNAIQPYVPALQNAIGQLAQWVGSVLAGAFDFLAGFIRDTVIPGLTTLGGWLADNIPVAIQKLADFWTNVLQPALAVAWGYIQNNLIPLFNELIGWLQTNIPQALQALSDFWQQHGDTILTAAQTAWQTIQDVIGAVLDTISGLWTAWNQAREGDWRGFGETLRSIWDASWEAVKQVIVTVGPQIVSALVQLATDAYNAFTSFDWGELGRNVIEGIAAGIRNGAAVIAEAARGAARAALEAAKGFLGIQSPSKVMADEVGLPMAQGLAAGFAEGMDGSALVGIVAGIRSLMEQIGAVLKGVGDAVSMSDWEDLAGPVGQMANMFKSLADAGQTLAGEGLGSWDAARGQVQGLIETARLVMTDLAPLLKGVGDAVSMSDWEDFTAPLKMLADSLSSISQISGLFAGEGGGPSLAGLVAPIRQLAIDARAVLVALDEAIKPISAGLPDKLKTLGDAAAGARSIADGALGLVRSLVQALTVKWADINFSDAGRMMADLTRMVVFFAERALTYTDALNGLDLNILTPLKTAADNLLGIADGARSIVVKLADALTVDWNAVAWSEAGVMMADLARMVIYFAEKAVTYTDALNGLDLSVLGPMKAAADNLLGIIDGARGAVDRLVDALKFDWSSIDWSAASGVLLQLISVASWLAHTLLAVANAYRGQITDAARTFVDALGLTGDVLSSAWSAVSLVQDILKAGGVTISEDAAVGIFDRLLSIVNLLVRQYLYTGNAFRGILTDAARAFNAALSLTSDAVSKSWGAVSVLADILKAGGVTITEDQAVGIFDRLLSIVNLLVRQYLYVGNAFRGIVTEAANNFSAALSQTADAASKSWGMVSLLTDIFKGGGVTISEDQATGILARLLDLGMALADEANRVMGEWDIKVKEGLTRLGTVLKESLDAATSALDLNKLLGGNVAPTFDLALLKQRLASALQAGKELADQANLTLADWDIKVKESLTRLGTVLKGSLEAATTALDLNKLLGGTVAPTFDIGLLKTRLASALQAGKDLADQANLTLAEWDIKVKDSLVHLGSVLKGSLEAATTALDLNKLLGGTVAPVFDVAVLKQRLASALQAGKDLGDQANATLGEWDIKVKESLGRLGSVLKGSLEAATTTLDINALLGGKTAPTFDVAVLKTRLALALQAGKELADEANRVIGEWDIKVKDSLSHLGTVLKDGLDVATSVLDFSELQSKLLNFRGFDMTLWGPKLDLIIAGAIAVAQEFGRRAAGAGIQQAWQDAASALSGLFGDAASTIGDALDMGARLLDPETQIPSIGQVQGKLDALFGLITNVATQFAAKAVSLASQGVDTKAAGELAGQVKSIFDSLSTVAQTVQDFTGIYTGSSGFNNIQALLDDIFGLFANVSAQAGMVEGVASAIAMMLGGLKNLAGASGYEAGQSWADRFAAGLAAGLGNVSDSAGRALRSLTGGGGSGGGSVTVTNNTYNNTYNNTLNLNVDSANAEAVTLNFNLLEAMSGA